MKYKIASKVEIKNAINAWWDYLAKKSEKHPYIADGLSTKRLYSDPSRTVKYSLVPGISPELSGLGKLVDAKKPHVYVEGIRTPDTSVLFNELVGEYFDGDKETEYIIKTLGSLGKTPRKFILWIYSSNDLDVWSRFIQNYRFSEFFFFTDEEDNFNAYSFLNKTHKIKPIEKINFSLKKDKSFPGLPTFKERKKLVKPATNYEIEIVCESFKNAYMKLCFP